MVMSVMVPAISFGIPMWVQLGVFMGAIGLAALVAAPKKVQRLAVALAASVGLASVAIQAAGSYPNFIILCNDWCLNFCCWF